MTLASEYQRLVEQAGAVRLDRDVIRVAGPDAVTYLQGQLSQDVAGLPVGAAAWSLILQPQGRVDAWVRVWRREDDEIVIDVDGGWADAIVGRLAKFKLRTKADIEPLDWSCIAVRGVAPPPVPGSIAADWPLIGGRDLVGPAPTIPAGVDEVGVEAYEVRRIEAGLPRMGAELTDRTIPAEAGVVAASVSFTKGCYTGQELVARIDSRGGHVPRLLRGVVIPSGAVPERDTPLLLGGKAVGTITSAVAHPAGHAVALASVHRDVAPPAEVDCGGEAATIDLLPG